MALKKQWLVWLAVPPVLLAAFVVGLFVYVNATVKPLHPDPNNVTSQTQSSPSAQWSATVEQARQRVRASVTEQNLPGVSIAVGSGGEIVWAEGFGWIDIESKAPVTPGIRFRTGGISMALTSAAVGLLLEKERLHLDSEIQTYVRAFPEKQWPLTLRQLMGHTAGIRGDAGDEEPLTERCEKTADGLTRFSQEPLRSEPGTKFRYSTYGWILVSAAVEAAAGEPFYAFMRSQIFKPLGMIDTTADSLTDPIPDRATFYHPRFGGDPRYGPDPVREGGYACFAGGGAFLSTASDLARFAMAINAGKLLQPATVKTFQTTQHLASGEDTGYGLGWDIDQVTLAGQSTTAVGHDSEFTMGGTASLMTFPDRGGLVVVVMTNTAFADTSSIALKVAEAFAQPATDPAIK